MMGFYVALFLACLWGGPLVGQEGPYRRLSDADRANRNIREHCRAKVAGYYFELKNRADRSSAFVATLKMKIKRLEAAVHQKSKELQSTLASRADAEFDDQLETKVVILSDAVKNLGLNLKTEKSLLKVYETDFSQAINDMTVFRKSLTKVFNIVKDKVNLGYKEKIVYKHECSKFEYLCPLPEGERSSLRHIMGESTPESCIRYSQMIPIQPRQ